MGQIVALDTMIFIYLLEADDRFLGKVEALFNQVEAGEIKAITSIVSVIEILSPDKYLDKENVQVEIVRFFQETSGLAVIPVSFEIGQLAAKLRRENKNLRTPDSIQLATAIVGGAGVFVTNDTKLAGLRIESLKIKILGEA